ncbi:hypothetical protein FITA111629_12435 [Filibacter tadaridae]|uniref:Uncharacterized protein n=1 Tax=Filibacter tadaridae TaxID=2483811 RepID=A0A3P5WUS7_9BACL|nr:hypothetical protein [Filibacter tadaridae]VDC25505.1 hypothetical protein FILTAD_01211 [Filibacter tadaridae]
MPEKPENARMTNEEAERYGREINARSAQYENVEVESDEIAMSTDEIPPPLSEEEIKRRVGEDNYNNITKSGVMNSVNS